MYEAPDLESVFEAFFSGIDTMPELMEYLKMRGDKYGITAQELFDAMPADAQSSPQAAYAFASSKDISHIQPTSKGGDTAGDNWMWEDPSPNRSRKDDPMTSEEKAAASADNVRDAKVMRNALVGVGTYTAANIAIDALTGVAVGTTTVAAEAIIASIAVPLICTGAVVGGGLWFLNRKINQESKVN